jgi:hypothetical protein
MGSEEHYERKNYMCPKGVFDRSKTPEQRREAKEKEKAEAKAKRTAERLAKKLDMLTAKAPSTPAAQKMKPGPKPGFKKSVKKAEPKAFKKIAAEYKMGKGSSSFKDTQERVCLMNDLLSNATNVNNAVGEILTAKARLDLVSVITGCIARLGQELDNIIELKVFKADEPTQIDETEDEPVAEKEKAPVVQAPAPFATQSVQTMPTAPFNPPTQS